MDSKIKITWLIIFFGVFCLAKNSVAAELQVGAGQAYSTISGAIAAAGGGDAITVHSGTYTENLTVSKTLTIRANAGDSPTINGRISISANDVVIDGFIITGWTGSNHGVYLSGRSGTTIRNCTIDGGAILTGSGSCIYIRNSSKTLISDNELLRCQKGINSNSSKSSDATYANGTTISNNLIHDNPVDGIDIHGEYYTIDGNTIYNNIDANWTSNHPDGIQGIRSDVDGYSNVKHVKIYNNSIYNHTQNIFMEGWGTADPADYIYIWNNVIYNGTGTVNGVDMNTLVAAGINIKGCNNAWVYNNYIGRHGGQLLRVQKQDTQLAGGMHIKNNIFDNSNVSGGYVTIEDMNALEDGELDNNQYDIAANTTISAGGVFYGTLSSFKAAYPSQENHGRFGDSQTDEPPTPVLREGSACIDSGASLGADYALDKNVISRPQGAGWDIGAYEYVSNIDAIPPAAPSGLFVS